MKLVYWSNYHKIKEWSYSYEISKCLIYSFEFCSILRERASARVFLIVWTLDISALHNILACISFNVVYGTPNALKRCKYDLSKKSGAYNQRPNTSAIIIPLGSCSEPRTIRLTRSSCKGDRGVMIYMTLSFVSIDRIMPRPTQWSRVGSRPSLEATDAAGLWRVHSATNEAFNATSWEDWGTLKQVLLERVRDHDGFTSPDAGKK